MNKLQKLDEMYEMMKAQQMENAIQGKKLQDLHFALFGNDKAKIKGAFQLVAEHETYIKRDRALKQRAVGGLAILTVIWYPVWEGIKEFYTKHIH